jgi:hypothetical protein
MISCSCVEPRTATLGVTANGLDLRTSIEANHEQTDHRVAWLDSPPHAPAPTRPANVLRDGPIVMARALERSLIHAAPLPPFVGEGERRRAESTDLHDRDDERGQSDHVVGFEAEAAEAKRVRTAVQRGPERSLLA